MWNMIVGDVHGCLEELDELLQVAGFPSRQRTDPDRTRLVFTGDLVDRGPDPVGVIRRCQELNGIAIKGNHEDKHLQYHKRLLQQAHDPTFKMRMRPFGEKRLKEHLSFTENEWDFMMSMPHFFRLDFRWVVVHGGLRPKIPIEKQHPDEMMRMRFIRRADGKMAKLSEEMHPKTHAFWTELWEGPESVIYGHHVSAAGVAFDEKTVSVEKFGGPVDIRVQCIGVDTGACFGKQLSAVIIDGGYVIGTVSVPAKAEYHSYRGQAT